MSKEGATSWTTWLPEPLKCTRPLLSTCTPHFYFYFKFCFTFHFLLFLYHFFKFQLGRATNVRSSFFHVVARKEIRRSHFNTFLCQMVLCCPCLALALEFCLLFTFICCGFSIGTNYGIRIIYIFAEVSQIKKQLLLELVHVTQKLRYVADTDF